MKKLLAAITVLLLSSSAFTAHANNGFDKLLVQKGKQSTNEECTKAAGKRKGNERKAFIEGCLRSSHTPKRNPNSCTEKAKAEGIHGAEREQFMEKCRRAQVNRHSR